MWNGDEKTNYGRHIWEGWTPGDFIAELIPQVEMIMAGQSWRKPFHSKAELEQWCADHQPYYKKPVTEVTEYFADLYGLS